MTDLAGYWSQKHGYGTIQNIVKVTGAAEVNFERSGDTEPWSPWSAQVMILAGVLDGQPWLWLGCRACGWFLGYSSQIDPAYLADAARRHREVICLHCEQKGAQP